MDAAGTGNDPRSGRRKTDSFFTRLNGGVNVLLSIVLGWTDGNEQCHLVGKELVYCSEPLPTGRLFAQSLRAEQKSDTDVRPPLGVLVAVLAIAAIDNIPKLILKIRKQNFNAGNNKKSVSLLRLLRLSLRYDLRRQRAVKRLIAHNTAASELCRLTNG
ncbi:hypothetical protein ACJJTC_016980 [Scirpophaga incertulas]